MMGEVNVEVKVLLIVLKLFDAPPQDLIVRIQDPRGGEGLEIPIQYIEPFTYSVIPMDLVWNTIPISCAKGIKGSIMS